MPAYAPQPSGVGPQGPPGPVGPPGPAGSGGDLSYVHNQAVPAAVWTVNHNLGKRPSVTVEDSAGTDVVGEVDHVNANTLTITFTAGFSGTAYLN